MKNRFHDRKIKKIYTYISTHMSKKSKSTKRQVKKKMRILIERVGKVCETANRYLSRNERIVTIIASAFGSLHSLTHYCTLGTEVVRQSYRIYIFVGLHQSLSISDLVGRIIKSSQTFINNKNWFSGKFSWQDGYGVFTYSRSQVDRVYTYIKNQEKHHKKRMVREEYIGLLEKFSIEYDEKYLFRFFSRKYESL